jgi:hypothetical protein
MPDFLRSLLETDSEAAAREALTFSPTNQAAFARLAQALRARNPKANSVLRAEADWCERKASGRMPH